MVKEAPSGGGIITTNLFSVLNNKKIKPAAELGEKKKKTPAPAAAPKVESKEEVKKPEPKKESKVISLAAVEKQQQAKELKKEEKIIEKTEKTEKAKTDRHDRSGKGHQVRKDGKGTGGWEDSVPVEAGVGANAPAWGDLDTADHSTAAAAVTEAPPRRELTEEQKAFEAEAAAARELEEKQMTLDEYLAQKKDKLESNFNIRTVDSSKFKNMKQKEKANGGAFFLKMTLGDKPAPAKEKVQKEVREAHLKKMDLAETGFRMENPSVAPAGRGGRGGRGEGRGRGGRGEARGRGGRFGGRSEDEAQPTHEVAPKIDSEEAFPSLGN